MLDPRHQYFPEADSASVAPFATAFLRMMFTHAELERRIRELQVAITGDHTFGERRKNQWPARTRPVQMLKLIKKHLGEIVEADQIKDCLLRSIKPCDVRNLLAHGTWWRFDPATEAITVAAGTAWQQDEGAEHRDVTVADINRIAVAFADLEVELWKLQTAIDERRRLGRPDEDSSN